MVYFGNKYYSNSRHSLTIFNGFNCKKAFSLAMAHFRLALAACENIMTELEHHGIIEPIPAGKDTYQVNVPVNMVKDKINADGSIAWRVVLDNRVVNDNLTKTVQLNYH